MRIFLVEDDIRIADQVTRSLERAGYVVDRATDGEDAWFRAETEAFDAVVLDLGLPKLDGLSVLRLLRGAGVTTPVLVLTARGSWMERVEGIDAGADDYLPKPFQSEELLSRLDAIVRRSAGRATSVMVAGALTMDARRVTATLDGEALPLSPREFLLLRYLVHNKGRVVSQVEIEEHIYGGEHNVASNAVETLVRRVRKKVGRNLIETRRGFGYVVAP